MIWLVVDNFPNYRRGKNRKLACEGVLVIHRFTDEWQDWGEYIAVRKPLNAVCRTEQELHDYLAENGHYEDYASPIFVDFPDDKFHMPAPVPIPLPNGHVPQMPLPQRMPLRSADMLLGRAIANIASWQLPPSVAGEYERRCARHFMRILIDKALHDEETPDRFLFLLSRLDDVREVSWHLVEALEGAVPHSSYNPYEGMVELYACLDVFLAAPSDYLPMFEEARVAGCSIEDIANLSDGWESAYDAWLVGVAAEDLFA